jgi:hypothetical protein
MTKRRISILQLLALAGQAAVAGGCTEAVASPENGLRENGAEREARLDGGCSFRRTEGAYGFSCAGSSNVGQGLVPIAAVGVVAGDSKGVFSGRGTLNSPLGSLPWRFKGPATLDADCFGRVSYDQNEVEAPPGSGNWIKLPPALFDFAVVDDGKEILGSAVAPASMGDEVPRLACRLVRVTQRR